MGEKSRGNFAQGRGISDERWAEMFPNDSTSENDDSASTRSMNNAIKFGSAYNEENNIGVDGVSDASRSEMRSRSE